MKRQRMIRWTLAALLAVAFFPGAESVRAADSKPNIVFVLFDDLGWGQPPCYDPKSALRTPNLDKLASQGMRFTDAHTASAVCTPTRYGVLTGRYPSRIGQFGVLGTWSPPIIPTSRATVASILKQQGYDTACVGKWHLGLKWEREGKGTPAIGTSFRDGPNQLGFDYFCGFTHAANINTVLEQDRVIADVRKDENQPLMLRKAVEWLAKRDAQKPFFLYFPLGTPHYPVAPAAEYVGKSGGLDLAGKELQGQADPARYPDWLFQGDAMLGEIMRVLDSRGLAQNTLLIATSDNGAEHRAYPPLRESKRSIYEGGHRVPFVARWPSKIKAGSTWNHPVCLNDLMATAAEITGATLPPNAGEDSVSLLPALLGRSEAPTHEGTIHQSIGGDFAIRQGPWKLIFKTDGSRELYNLASDLSETQDVLAANAEVAAKLTALMRRYITEGRSTPGAAQQNDFNFSIDSDPKGEKRRNAQKEKKRSSQPSAALFPPGEAIRVSPQRGMAQIGRGPVGNTDRPIIMGTADVFGKGPYDLFLIPDRLLPFRGFDQQGTPYYGPQITTKGRPMNGMVLTGKDQQIYGVFSGGKSVHVCRFDRASSTFEPFAESPQLDIPGPLGVGIACYIDASDKVNVYFSVADGVAYRPPPPPDFKEGEYPPYYHRSSYIPYDGAGFWRGNIPRRMLYRARFDSLKLGNVELVERVSNGPGEFPFDCWGLAVLNLGKNQAPGLCSGEHLGMFHYYTVDPATGALRPNDFLNNEEENGLRHFAINTSVKSIPDPQTGHSNLIVGDTARVWFYPFSGRFSANGAPIYKAPAAVLGEGIPMSLGELPIISPGDIDQDGLIDLIVGNDAGQLMFVKNIGTKNRPEFDHPLYVSVGGKPLDIKAGYRGSVQGPGEAMWGYTCPTLRDWNGDGRLDVILNSVLGDYVVLLQLPLDGAPKFTEPKWLYSDGIQLHLAWRCQPGVTDWGKPGGRLCVIGLDEQNLLRCFWRIDNENVERGELLKLQDGSSITANVDEQAGQTGRAKLVPHDWDQDGKIDLLIGTSRGLSFPASKTVYYPSAFRPNHKASVLFLRNVGTNEDPVFDYVRFVEFRGKPISFHIHDCSPAPVDLGRGVIDLLVSEENGNIHYYPREELSIGSAAESNK